MSKANSGIPETRLFGEASLWRVGALLLLLLLLLHQPPFPFGSRREQRCSKCVVPTTTTTARVSGEQKKRRPGGSSFACRHSRRQQRGRLFASQLTVIPKLPFTTALVSESPSLYRPSADSPHLQVPLLLPKYSFLSACSVPASYVVEPDSVIQPLQQTTVCSLRQPCWIRLFSLSLRNRRE